MATARRRQPVRMDAEVDSELRPDHSDDPDGLRSFVHRWKVAGPLLERERYLRLRELSPAPYAAFLDQGDRQVLSSSPESFLKMTGDLIQTLASDGH